MILSRAPGFDVRRAFAWGATWAVTVAVVEALAISSLDAWGSMQQLIWWLIDWTVPFWCAVGALLVWLVERRERSGSLLGLMSGFLLVCVLTAGFQPVLSTGLVKLTQNMLPSLERYTREAGITRANLDNWAPRSLYETWVNVFYGALLVAACTWTLRAERIRHLFHRSAMARSRTEALLDEERLQALQAQIDPSLLLDSMQELKQRYRISPDGAERLLEALVEFLRYAMHGLRTPVSTVGAELQLARAFAALQRERGVEGAWRIVEELSPGVQPCKFPSLLMLPLLALGGEGRRPLLRVRADPRQTVLSIHGIERAVSAELCQQIRSRLRALYGDGFTLDAVSLAQGQLVIALQSGILNPGDHHDGSITR